MKNLFFLLLLLSVAGVSQTSLLAEFKAMPPLPAGAREAFKASKTDIVNGYVTYLNCSEAFTAYSNKLNNDQKPYVQIAETRATKTNPAAAKAAADFSDLNSPETQARIAKMSQEEKLKFAMEVQARMAQNKNVQAINTINKPSPLATLSLKVNASGRALQMALESYKPTPFPGYSKCQGMCKETDPTCAAKVQACESKISHDFYNAEISAYAAFLKAQSANFAAKKIAFENDLKEFDTQAAKFPKEDLAADYSGLFVLIGSISGRLIEMEKAGSQLIIDAKNNPYCKSDF